MAPFSDAATAAVAGWRRASKIGQLLRIGTTLGTAFTQCNGIALSALGPKTAKVTELLEQGAFLMLKVTGYVMAAAPLAVFGALAAAIGTNGVEVIVDYGRLVGTFFLALFVLWALLITAGFVVLGPRVFKLMAMVRAPGLLAFSTASSEAAYPRLLEQLERFGIANRVVMIEAGRVTRTGGVELL